MDSCFGLDGICTSHLVCYRCAYAALEQKHLKAFYQLVSGFVSALQNKIGFANLNPLKLTI
jgi:hypothetical protein